MSSVKCNPFKHVLPIDPRIELDRAIGKARKITLSRIGDRVKRYKALIASKIELIKQHMVSKFTKYVKLFPNINSLHPFYRDIIGVYSSVDEVKKNLGRINGAVRTIRKLSDDYKNSVKSIRKTRYFTENELIIHIKKLWIQYLARIYSFISRISDAFYYINSLSSKLKKLPDYDPEYQTIVVCGPPNSGKSSLVGEISNAKVQVASYPFTTKNLVFGHIKIDTVPPTIIQIVDSPGLFDKPISKRKGEELLALRAIKTIADCIIFLFDGSHERTLDLDAQMRIFENILELFPKEEKIVAINKIDIKDDSACERLISLLKNMRISPILLSVKNGTNLDKLMKKIRHIFTGSAYE